MPSFELEVAVCKQSINQILFYQILEQNLPFESPTQLYQNWAKLKQNLIHLSPTQARFLTARKWWIQD